MTGFRRALSPATLELVALPLADARRPTAARAEAVLAAWRGGAPAVVVGRNRHALAVVEFARAEGLPLAGVVASDVTEPTCYGLPVVRVEELAAGTIGFNAVIDGRAVTVQKRLRRAGAIPCTTLELHALAPERFPVEFLGEPWGEAAAERFAALAERLSDEWSVQTLDAVLRFRATLDVDHLSVFPFDIERQYVEGFLRDVPLHTLVDAGAYDGVSAATLMRAYPSLRRAVLLEPDVGMRDRISATMAGFEAEVRSAAAWSRSDRLVFESAGPGSRVSSGEGASTVEAVALDDLGVPGRGAFVKLDIEGAELEALAGMRRMIAEGAVLTVAVYHDNRHLLEVPERVLAARPGARVYARHYTEGRFETILTFV